MIWVSALLVFGAVGWLLTSLAPSAELALGFEQLIHAPIPWALLATLWIGAGLGLAALVRGRRRFAIPIVGLELLLVGLVSFYFLRFSWLPEHTLALDVGESFPAYSMLDQDEALHTVPAGGPRAPALYIFYRGDW